MTDKRRSRFLLVKCTECENEQLVFSCASTVVKCQVCSETLSVPRGGKAEVRATLLGAVE